MIRVLHAEDNPQIAELVRFTFDRTGGAYAITGVTTGLRCLEEMQRGEFDLLLLDLKMPDLDGLQVLGELMARRDSTPVIMVSGQGQHELAVRALRAGAVDCIDKNSPDFIRLPEIVQQAIARHRRQLQNSAKPSSTFPWPHRILFLDASAAARSEAAKFFEANAPRLLLTAAEPGALEKLARGEIPCDAVVLGPHFESTGMLNALRQLRTREHPLPTIVLAKHNDGDVTVAAFKLGATDYLLHGPGCLAELVFALNNALKHADTERLNAQLTSELAELNRSLASQVADRTRELETEIGVRREAERRASAQAERLQALSTRLLRVQEDERRALAQELHDQVGQLLTGLRFQLEAAVTAGSDLGESLALTDELLRGIRELTLQLRPRILDDFGLKPALEWHVGRFAKQTGIAVELDLSLPEKRLAPELETAAYRLVQESLTNVARHSGSPSAVVTAAASDTALHVEISDRGNGFDVSAALARQNSLGLAGMSERVKLAGGQFEIVSQPGQGTRLHAEFSLVKPELPSP
ncbi:MAG TPA: response regulator [Opitutaceae bacterium]|nr:response regulator [Opitutaceae bacterium]